MGTNLTNTAQGSGRKSCFTNFILVTLWIFITFSLALNHEYSLLSVLFLIMNIYYFQSCS